MRRDAVFVVCGVARSCDQRAVPNRTNMRSHICAIRVGFLIAYMCDRMFVRLRTPGGAGVQRSGSLFTHFWVKSHDRATTVMGCMKIHTYRTGSSPPYFCAAPAISNPQEGHKRLNRKPTAPGMPLWRLATRISSVISSVHIVTIRHWKQHDDATSRNCYNNSVSRVASAIYCHQTETHGTT
jgi:hypothetical protein